MYSYAVSICIQRVQERILGMIRMGMIRNDSGTPFQRAGIERQYARPVVNLNHMHTVVKLSHMYIMGNLNHMHTVVKLSHMYTW